MKKKIIIIALAVIVVGSVLFCGINIAVTQKKEMQEIIDILLQTSGSAHLEDMLAGKGSFGEKYMKLKESDSFNKEVRKSVTALLESDPGYDNAVKNLRVLYYEDFIDEELQNQISDFENSYAEKYAEKFETALTEGKYDNVADKLAWLLERDLFEKSGIDIDVTIDKLLESCKVFSVKNDSGAYYDDVELKSSGYTQYVGAEGMESVGSIYSSYIQKAYGDFCIGTASKTSYYEALEEFEELADKYNTTEQSKTLYFRGKKVDGHFYCDTLDWVCKKGGAEYIICHENEVDADKIKLDGVLILSKDKIYVMSYYSGNPVYDYSGNRVYDGYEIGIEGDFSKVVQKAEKLYKEKYIKEIELAKAKEFFDKKQYAEAVEIWQFYEHVDEVSENLYTIAVESIKEGNVDFGLEVLELVPGFESMRGLKMNYMIEKIDEKFNPNVTSSKNYYPLPFLRLMMDVKGAMSGNDIVEALTDKQFSAVQSGNYSFKADRSGIGNQREITWEVRENTLLINEKTTGVSYVYNVYNVFADYYLLTVESSSTMKMTLLKSK